VTHLLVLVSVCIVLEVSSGVQDISLVSDFINFLAYCIILGYFGYTLLARGCAAVLSPKRLEKKGTACKTVKYLVPLRLLQCLMHLEMKNRRAENT